MTATPTLLQAARYLTERAPTAENPEYDRALVELVCDALGASMVGDESQVRLADEISLFITGRSFDDRARWQS